MGKREAKLRRHHGCPDGNVGKTEGVGSSKSQFSKPNSVTKTGISSHILPNVVITYIDIDKNIVFPSYSMKE